MMRTAAAVILLVALLVGCASVQPLPPERLVIQKIVDVPNVPKSRVFEKSKIWFARTFRQSMAGWWEQNSTRTVIQYEDGEKGVLIANGAILYPLAPYAEAYKEGWEVRFTLQEEVKEGRARVTFSNLNLFVPRVFCGNSYAGWASSYEKRLNADEYEKVKPLFLDLADQLGAYLAAPEQEW